MPSRTFDSSIALVRQSAKGSRAATVLNLHSFCEALWEGHGFSRATGRSHFSALAAEGGWLAADQTEAEKKPTPGAEADQKQRLMAWLKPCPSRGTVWAGHVASRNCTDAETQQNFNLALIIPSHRRPEFQSEFALP